MKFCAQAKSPYTSFMKLFTLPLLLSLVFVSTSQASVPIRLPALSANQTVDHFRAGLLKAQNRRGIQNSSTIVFGNKPATRQGVHTAIVGGVIKPDGSYPFAVRVESYDLISTKKTPQPFCSGSLISDVYVLTAAHCLAQSTEELDQLLDVTKLRVRFANLPSKPVVSVVRTAYAGAFNPYLIGENSQSDLAVLQLASSAPTAPVAIAASPPLGETVSELGYGPSRLHESDGMSKQLRQGKMKVSSPAICGSKKYHLTVFSNEICTTTSPPNLNGAACHGDSGGSLIYEPENSIPEIPSPSLVGVTSWSKIENCDVSSPKRQTVFANIMDSSAWLAQQTGLGDPGAIDHSTVSGGELKIDAFNKRRAIISLQADDPVWGANATVEVDVDFARTKRHRCFVCYSSLFVVGEFDQSAKTQTLNFPKSWSKRKIKRITISSFLRFVGENGNGVSVIPNRYFIK